MPQSPGRPTLKRSAFVIASLGVSLSILGSIRAAAMFRSHELSVMAWMALPLTAATVEMLATQSRWFGLTWSCTGVVFGFVIVGAWSLGPFYALTAVMMLAASLVHLLAVRPGWKALAAPLWLGAGAGGLCGALLMRDVLQTTGTTVVTHAPIVVSGAWLGLAAGVLLIAVHTLARVCPSRDVERR